MLTTLETLRNRLVEVTHTGAFASVACMCELLPDFSSGVGSAARLLTLKAPGRVKYEHIMPLSQLKRTSREGLRRLSARALCTGGG